MREIISLDKKPTVIDNEVIYEYQHKEYNTLILYPNLEKYERISGFCYEVSKDLGLNFTVYIDNFSFYNKSILERYLKKKSQNVEFKYDKSTIVIYGGEKTQSYPLHSSKIVIMNSSQKIDNYTRFNWSDIKTSIYVHDDFLSIFKDKFRYFIQPKNLFKYDNLLHLVMIVKNAGDIIRKIIKVNIPFIDRWTILDTGSTDNTIQIIKEELNDKVKGELFEEPFINFRESRNRAIDLCGETCTYQIMLDDTYELRGDVRDFLTQVRTDQFADSFSLYIQSNDVQYTSNRIIKTQRKLRYKFRIHEVITDENNKNIIVPIQKAFIFDHRSDYMEQRTKNRKLYDLKLLQESVEEEPEQPRHLYYMAQTYQCLENREMAFKYFLRRFYHSEQGFLQEKIDAGFEAARLANFNLNKPWDFCKNLYDQVYELDKTRPDCIYFIGAHYLITEKNETKALEYFRKAFEIGFPLHAQYSLKPTLSFYFLPKLLTPLCLTNDYNDWILGFKACELFFQNPTPQTTETPDISRTMAKWYNIYKQLLTLNTSVKCVVPAKPILCFVADGNWNPWTGRDIESKGMGGSETHVIEMARHIQKLNVFDVYVFCKCSKEEVFEGVQYLDISKYGQFISEVKIHSAIISRYTEYIPLTYKSKTEHVYLFLHDLANPFDIIIRDCKLKKIFCLTEWHKQQFDSLFVNLTDLSTILYYGIDTLKFSQNDDKISNRFIYSSFPNRGLLPLLEMWNSIVDKIPNATLDIFSDVNHSWTNQHFPNECKKIRNLLDSLKNKGIRYHGWVDKQTLASAWKKADIWLYPCIFQETFCLTALEAAMTKTLVVTTNLAALNQTVADRGILIPGDPMKDSWKKQALNTLLNLSLEKKSELIQKNYDWASKLSWKNQAKLFFNRHISENFFEYSGKINWTTNTFLLGTANYMTRIILGDHFKKSFVHVLEINPFSGTSIIQILSMFKNSKGTVCGNVLDAFHRNIELANISPEIFKNTDSVIFNFYRDQNFFDIISFFYDGDKSEFQNYSFLQQSWSVLNDKGLLIIHDTPEKIIRDMNFSNSLELFSNSCQTFFKKKQ